MKGHMNLAAVACALSMCFADGAEVKKMRGSDERELKKSKSSKSSKESMYDAYCDRGDVWSTANLNPDWGENTYYPQVWYHSFDDVHELWENDYFDYVLDPRPLEDTDMGDEVVLGFETVRIPNSYSIACADMTCEHYRHLEYFMESDVCMDSRILVVCWTGEAANINAAYLASYGFTNVHVAGPEGSVGMAQWVENGWEVEEDEEYDEDRYPQCYKKCNDYSSKSSSKSSSSSDSSD